MPSVHLRRHASAVSKAKVSVSRNPTSDWFPQFTVYWPQSNWKLQVGHCCYSLFRLNQYDNFSRQAIDFEITVREKIMYIYWRIVIWNSYLLFIYSKSVWFLSHYIAEKKEIRMEIRGSVSTSTAVYILKYCSISKKYFFLLC